MLGRVMPAAGVPVSALATEELADIVRAVGADELADRLDRALADDTKILALTIDERGRDPRPARRPARRLRKLRAVLLNEHQWRHWQHRDWLRGSTRRPEQLEVRRTLFGVKSGMKCSGDILEQAVGLRRPAYA